MYCSDHENNKDILLIFLLHFIINTNFLKFLKKKKKKTLNLIAEVFQTLLTPKDVVIKLH